MSPGRRAWDQCVETTFLVGALIAVVECALPVIEQRMIDWNQLLFACAFSILVILAHTIAAYFRPVERDETAERVEQTLAAFEERWHPQPGPSPPRMQQPGPQSIRMQQLQQWAANDPTWAPTTPGLPTMPRPPMPSPTQRPTQRGPRG
jgi:hypothetical protein